ncbi:MAG TPA: NUMOD4 domain-containing protein [Candidatus Nanoarchaeia archaeon]|nr:NUMOD4 domain-containing protein [Candidatus Nanoarchaeia archaeon]
MKEIWKDIKGYEGLYLVSNLGRIKSLERTIYNGRIYYNRKEKILKIQMDSRKYYCLIFLYKMNIKKVFLIHRLVAHAFISNPKNKPEINHKDGNKQNNKSNNLEWSTSSENKIHAFKTGLRIFYNQKPFICIETGITYKCLLEASKELNIHISSIHRQLTGIYRQTKGYTFKYLLKDNII